MVIAQAGINIAHFLGFAVLNSGTQDPHSATFKIDRGQRWLIFIRT